jgi:pyruvate formate lyase activating enzyme
MNPTGLVFDIRRYSLHDGPGIRTTVFLKGCPLTCWWCHNPESRSAARQVMVRENLCLRCGACAEHCQQDAISLTEPDTPRTDPALCILCSECLDACTTGAREIVGSEMTVAQVMAQIERDTAFFDESGGGVTVSGGEPLNQTAFVRALLRRCKELELHIALDTCGYAPWRSFEAILDDVDLFLYDLKLFTPEAHQRYTGVSNRPILENLTRLDALGKAVIVRIPLVPGVNDCAGEIDGLAGFVAGLKSVRRVDLLPYHPTAIHKYERLELPYRLPSTPAPTEEQIAHWAERLRAYGLQVKIGG